MTGITMGQISGADPTASPTPPPAGEKATTTTQPTTVKRDAPPAEEPSNVTTVQIGPSSPACNCEPSGTTQWVDKVLWWAGAAAWVFLIVAVGISFIKK